MPPRPATFFDRAPCAPFGRAGNGRRLCAWPAAALRAAAWRGVFVAAFIAPAAALARTLPAPPQAAAPPAKKPPTAVRSAVVAPRALLQTAQSYLGVPYVWGGTTAHGFDCSGFVGAVYAQHGYRLPRVSRQQALVGTEIHTLPLAAGDLLFFAEIPGSARVTHVAMSLGGKRFIHAALGKGEVTYDSLDENYYARRWLGARRVLDLVPGNYATVEGMAPTAAALNPHRPIAATTEAHAVPRDMVVEHTEGKIPSPLARPTGRASVFQTAGDPFSYALLLPQETGGGLRFGSVWLENHEALFLQPELRFFGHGTSLQIDVAAPFLWPVSGDGRHLPGRGVSWHSARDWGRILRTLSFGRRDARLYMGLERALAMTLGDGILMRHFVANGESGALEDLLAEPSDLTAVLQVQGNGLELTWMLDDIFVPQVTGLHLRYVPTAHGTKFASRRLGFNLGWAMDHAAPLRQLDVPLQPVLHKTVQLLEGGISVLLSDAALVARTYLNVAGRVASTRPLAGAMGATFGFLASLGGHTGVTPAGHTLSLRLEARFGGAGWRANYMPFAYAQNRLGAPYRNAGGSQVTGEVPQLTLLLAQKDQPRHVSGLVELLYAYGNRVSVGVAYEDGGPMGTEGPGPVPVDRNVTAYVMARNVPLGLGSRTLRARLLWHYSAADKLWPPFRTSQAHTFTAAMVRADILPWLDAGLSLRKPLGPSSSRGRTLVGSGDISAHFAY